MTIDEKIQTLENEGYVLAKEPYTIALTKSRDPYLGHGHFEPSEFLPEEHIYTIREYVKENSNDSEKRYVIEDDEGRLVNKSLSRLKYYDSKNKEKLEAEEKCIETFAKYGVGLEKGDVIIGFGYFPEEEEIKDMVDHARNTLLNDHTFARGLEHVIKVCGYNRQDEANCKLIGDYAVRGANSSHQDYIAKHISVPIIKAVVNEENEKGRYVDFELAELAGQEAMERNFNLYCERLTPNKLIKQGLSPEMSRDIIGRIDSGEKIESYYRLRNIKDAIRLSDRFSKLADKYDTSFDRDAFLENYIFSGYKTIEHDNYFGVGSYRHLSNLAEEPIDYAQAVIRKKFFDEFNEKQDILEACIQTYEIEDLRLLNEHSAQEKEEITNFWREQYKNVMPTCEEHFLAQNKEANERNMIDAFTEATNRYLTAIFYYNEHETNCKDDITSILGRGALKDFDLGRESGRIEYIYPLMGEYIKESAEYKELVDKFENILNKITDYNRDWNEYPEKLVRFDKDDNIYRYEAPMLKICKMVEEAEKLEEKENLLNKIIEMNFYEPTKIEDISKDINSWGYSEKIDLIREGKNIPEIFENEQNKEIIKTLIENGYGINKFVDHENEYIAKEALDWLDSHKMTINEYECNYPERTFKDGEGIQVHTR